MHPFWAPVLALFFAFVLCRYFIVNKEKRKKAAHIIWIMAIVMIICMFIFYLYRMIVYYPDVEPMVYDEKNIVNVIRMLPGIV